MIFEITWMNRMGQDDFGAWWNPYVYVKCHKNGSYVEVGGKLFLVQVNIPSYHLIFCFHHPNICWNFENHLGKVLQSGIIVLYVHFDNPTFMHLTCRKLFLCIPLIALILTYVFPRHYSKVWFTTFPSLILVSWKSSMIFTHCKLQDKVCLNSYFFNAGFLPWDMVAIVDIPL